MRKLNFQNKIYMVCLIAILLIPMSITVAIVLASPDDSVEPDTINVTLCPGESIVIDKLVTTPLIPPKLDLLLLEDETGSFDDDIETMQGTLPDCLDGLAAAMWDGIDAIVDDFQAGVAGFRDFAQDGWGMYNDWVYRLLQDLTDDKTTWLTGICALTAWGGLDWPESQLAALKSGADGTAWDSNGNGIFDEGIDTPADQNPNWREDSTKVIVLVTDAEYHVQGEPPPPGWPGPTYAEAVTALNAENIHVIVLTLQEYIDLGTYDSLAAETGGTVKAISSDSSDIVDAVLEALEEILTDVWWEVECDEPGITVSLIPEVYYDVIGGSVLSFSETIQVANEVVPGTYYCTVTFYANEHPEEGTVIGTQEIIIEVILPVNPPIVDVTLYPGESIVINKLVKTPLIPPKLDLLLLEDETGSFVDDIETMQGTLPDCLDGLAAAMWDGIDAIVDDFQAGVAGFRDFAQDGWGMSGISNDWVYRLLQDLTDDKSTWLTGIFELTAYGGLDWPESQLAALKSAADGMAWDSNGDLDLDDPCDTLAGQNPGWREDSTKVIVLVTDAEYHEQGDPPSPGWPGPTYAETIAALTAENIHVIVLTINLYLSIYTTLATDTGGVVKEISDDSSDIVDAVLEALEEILTDVWWEVECDEPGITVSLIPEVYYDVIGGSVLSFSETIHVANEVVPGTYYCTLTFYANEYPEEGSVIGTQEITIEVIPIPVDIDIKPGSFPNSINTKSKGVIPVAILGSECFDVNSVNIATLLFADASPVHVAMEDVNSDGYMDIISHYRTQETNINPGDEQACLTGNLLDGRAFEGCDSVLVRK